MRNYEKKIAYVSIRGAFKGEVSPLGITAIYLGSKRLARQSTRLFCYKTKSGNIVTLPDFNGLIAKINILL